MRRHLLLVLLAITATANAVVIRSDVPDPKYRMQASAFPALADMPGEGHGVLIAPQWVVTAAHAAPMQGMEEEVTIGGVARKVERITTYPGYKTLPQTLIKPALGSGDWSRVHAFLGSSNDIALIKLASPVTDVVPVRLYRGNQEVGKTVEIIGKGATGYGANGEDPHSSHRTVLRRAFNVVTGVDARYLWYRFDSPPSALPREGIAGSGDSGGPVVIEDHGQQQLVGLASWNKYGPSNDHEFHPGLYGQVVYNVRISRYVKWIESVIAAQASTISR